jgi:glyoxylase-like metal-dependent hydrolase (beta-lactamase superfamily II)/rhodanese-related sulfurtransferase
MIIEQIYTGCIAEAAYFLSSEGEAAIVDPLRDIQPYLDRIEKEGVKLKYIFETHFHADFVSGHIDLAKKTGATIVYGPTTMSTGFEKKVGQDGEVFTLGGSTITLIHTPGHTMESSCYLLKDEQGKERGIITGDTLFIGDVGRPDLAQHVVEGLTQDKLARYLFHSLRTKIMPLSDELIVYPNHGAGSACGKNMSKETTDTLGNQKRSNYALNPALTEDEFVAIVLNGLVRPPQYFPKNVLMNIQGYEQLDAIIAKGMTPLSVAQVERFQQDANIMLLDTRAAHKFAKGFIPGSVNIGLDGNFAMWVGELIDNLDQSIVLIADDEEQVKESITRLSRVGYDHCIGYLQGGFEVWQKAGKLIDHVQRISAQALSEQNQQAPLAIFDIRKISEFQSEHLEAAINIPLNDLEQQLDRLPKDQAFVVHCAGGYRSMIAASLLKKKGYQNFVDVIGGFATIKETSMPKTDYVCPSTLL